jgi:CheY-like chemotaxis protein
MKVLILDDDPVRRKALGRMWKAEAEVHTVGDYLDAVGLLDVNDYDVVSLDYDLGPESTACGLDVAEHIARMSPKRWPKKVVIHSGSEGGTRDMLQLLNAVGINCTTDWKK